MKGWRYFFKFILKCGQHFVLDIKDMFAVFTSSVRKPRNWSQLIIAAVALAALFGKLDVMWFVLIGLIVYARMQWIDGTIHKELKEEYLRNLKDDRTKTS